MNDKKNKEIASGIVTDKEIVEWLVEIAAFHTYLAQNLTSPEARKCYEERAELWLGRAEAVASRPDIRLVIQEYMETLACKTAAGTQH